MRRRTRIWLAAASLFTLVNAAGAGYAAAIGEGMHAGIHVALAVLGAYLVWRLTPRAEWQVPAGLQSIEDRHDQLQQSIDAVALEVERIGEAQRFSDKLQAERIDSRP